MICHRFWTAIVFIICFIVGAASSLSAKSRVALVVGNAAYENKARLRNPVRDARAVDQTLRAAGFRVILATDVSRVEFEAALRKFYRAADNAQAALLYYSGHGLQVSGENYLLPIDAKLATAKDLDLEAFPLGNIQRFLEARAKTSLLFFDACRNNPFVGRSFEHGATLTRGTIKRGFAPVRVRTGTLISFATDPNQVAFDGDGEISPFTRAFTRYALTPGLELRHMLTRVRLDVLKETQDKQTPWENSALLDNFYFVAPRMPPRVAPVQTLRVPRDSVARKLQLDIPYHPNGGELDILIERAPNVGKIMLDGQVLSSGSRFGVEKLGKVQFDARGVSAPAIATSEYRVLDKWGQSNSGVLVLEINNSSEPESGREPPDARQDEANVTLGRLHKTLARQTRTTFDALIGVGPQRLNLAIPDELPDGGNDWRVKILSSPENGLLRRGARVLLDGHSVKLSDLGKLTYEPAVGAGQIRTSSSFRIETRTGRHSLPVQLNLAAKLHACDRFAGEPFDLQGVARPGIRSAYLSVKNAEPACLRAVREFPKVARFTYQLGRVEQAKGNADGALQLFRKAAKSQYTRANYAIGLLYSYGGGVRVDHREAARWYEIAAATGDPYGMHGLGKALYRGAGVRQDRLRGLTLLLQAADLGHTFALNELGTIFGEGLGLAKDPARALRYYRASAARNDIYGYNNMGVLHLDGVGVAKNYETALKWFKLAHLGGHPYAGTNIGRMYFFGRGVAKSLDAAALWYELSAARGDAWAAYNRGWIAQHGPKNLRDLTTAARFFARAVVHKRGEPSARALSALSKLPGAAKRDAIYQLLLRAMNAAQDTPTSKRNPAESAALKHLLDQSDGLSEAVLDQTLLSVSRKDWLKSKPRFDLF